MPEKWTGELIGKMHNNKITYDKLAKQLGVTKAYVSMVLNGARNPAEAKERFERALTELIPEDTTLNARYNGQGKEG